VKRAVAEMISEPPYTRTVRTVVWEAHWRSFGRQPSTRLNRTPMVKAFNSIKD